MAIRFNAATDRISHTASNPPDPASGFTITAWAYLSVDQDDFSALARLSANDGASTSANMSTHSSGTTMGYLSSGGLLVSGYALSVGFWSRVAISATGTSGKVYAAPAVGAVDLVSGTVGGAATPTMLTVGGRSVNDGSEWFNGRIAYLRIWSIELSQAEIEFEWASATVVKTANLWADYPLTIAGDLNDASGNGRHLVAGSTSVTTEDGPPLSTFNTATFMPFLM